MGKETVVLSSICRFDLDIDTWNNKDKFVIIILCKSNKVSTNLVTTLSSDNCTGISADCR